MGLNGKVAIVTGSSRGIGQTPLGRLGSPDDIASAVAMLVFDDAHWVTGQNIRATGAIV